MNAGAVFGVAVAFLGGVLGVLLWRKSRVIKKILKKPVKGVLLVRTDLKMGKGKIAAQGMHAAYAAGIDAQRNPINILWGRYGYKKVALQVVSQEEMEEVSGKLKRKRIPIYPIHDAGRTQVEPNTWTVTFAGPAYEEDLDEVTGHLKLL